MAVVRSQMKLCRDRFHSFRQGPFPTVAEQTKERKHNSLVVGNDPIREFQSAAGQRKMKLA